MGSQKSLDLGKANDDDRDDDDDDRDLNETVDKRKGGGEGGEK